MNNEETILRIISNKNMVFLNEVASKWLSPNDLKIYNMMLHGVPVSGMCRASKCCNTIIRKKRSRILELMKVYCWRHVNDEKVVGVYNSNLTKKQVRMILLLERRISQRTIAKTLGIKQNAVMQMSKRITKRLEEAKDKETKQVTKYVVSVLNNYKFSKLLIKGLDEEIKIV